MRFITDIYTAYLDTMPLNFFIRFEENGKMQLFYATHELRRIASCFVRAENAWDFVEQCEREVGVHEFIMSNRKDTYRVAEVRYLSALLEDGRLQFHLPEEITEWIIHQSMVASDKALENGRDMLEQEEELLPF